MPTRPSDLEGKPATGDRTGNGADSTNTECPPSWPMRRALAIYRDGVGRCLIGTQPSSGSAEQHMRSRDGDRSDTLNKLRSQRGN